MRDLARRHGPVMMLHIGEVATVVLSSREAARHRVRDPAAEPHHKRNHQRWPGHRLRRLRSPRAGFNPADLLWPSSRLARWISSAERRAEEARKTVFRTLDDIIKDQIERLESGAGAGEAEVLLKIQRDGQLRIPLHMDVIKGVIFDIFAAGSETAATVFEWVMAELMRNPKAMQRAVAEVRSVFSACGTIPEHALKYLPLVIRETLRLHPPLPLLVPREAREPCRVLGYDVLPGAMVVVNVWALGCDERYWPGDPEEFRPERFEGSEVDFKDADFELLPFGAGRRICPGVMFGLANVELSLASLLFHFDWEPPNVADPTQFDMTKAFDVTMRRKFSLLLELRHLKRH
ncbi:hypothetical protein PR202_ga24655 [Eleusine coracana subsp. coracana]|uniref:Uncharacterized protein n=1 Tax=Eleusine coracana subsp. coracana TaxID=191504 RepID=A0AAV5D7H5_ELECO|nr:hypothetical protein PR202_ga24655 [Eleusine coracana subsp. coracana]